MRQSPREAEDSASCTGLERALAPPSSAGGSASAGEVKELKIKLSHKEKEIRELQQKLKDQQVFLDQKDRQLREAEKER